MGLKLKGACLKGLPLSARLGAKGLWFEPLLATPKPDFRFNCLCVQGGLAVCHLYLDPHSSVFRASPQVIAK